MKKLLAAVILSFSFINNALAEAPSHSAEGSILSVLPMLVIFVLVFYFLLIRPQNRRAKEHRKLLEGISKGDEVSTNGGILGQVKKIDEQFVTLEIASGVEILIQKGAITNVLPKGTFKTA